MADDSEIKEADPVMAIREALNKALGTLKKLLGQEDEELKEEMEEVGAGVSSGQATAGKVSDQPGTAQDTSKQDDASE